LVFGGLEESHIRSRGTRPTRTFGELAGGALKHQNQNQNQSVRLKRDRDWLRLRTASMAGSQKKVGGVQIVSIY